MKTTALLIANCTLLIAHCFSQGNIDIDNDIRMGIAGTEHVKITTNNFSIHQEAASPLIYGDFGSGNVGIGTNNPSEKLHISGSISASGDLKFGSKQTLQEVKFSTGDGSQAIEVPLGSDNAPLYAQITLYGTQTNTKNEKFLWNGVLVWDTNYNQHRLYTLHAENLSAVAFNRNGEIGLDITDGSTFNYAVIRGIAFVWQ